MNRYGVTEEQYEKMMHHLSLVIEANKITNLTRIDTIEDGQLLHIEDSLAGLAEINDAPEGLYADLGTGGGFPGIPIAIATGRKTTLVDTRHKKTEALDVIIEQLGLSESVRTYTGRIEFFGEEERGKYSVISARALAKISVLMELAQPLLKKGGRLVCYKANIEREELDHAKALESQLGMKIVSDREFDLSDGETHRRIIVLEKVGKAKIKLPRHVGFAQKKPL